VPGDDRVSGTFVLDQCSPNGVLEYVLEHTVVLGRWT
jgi:hypothetical protein